MSIASLNLKLEQIKDPVVRDALQLLRSSLEREPLLRGEFQHFELVFDAAATNYRHRHGLGFAPRDVIQTWLLGAGAVTWNYSLFTKEYLDLTVSGPCTVRALIGRYLERSTA